VRAQTARSSRRNFRQGDGSDGQSIAIGARGGLANSCRPLNFAENRFWLTRIAPASGGRTSERMDNPSG
jgi:hypothetical protein